MGDIAADKAELIALFVETLLYGIFVVLFFESLRILTDKRTGPKINWPLLTTSVGIFMTATGHLAIILCRALDAFIDHREDRGGPVEYYANLRNALEVTQASFQIAISILGDGMAVYRVFMVYNRNYLAIVLPAVSFAGSIAASIGSVVIIGQASTRTSAFYFPKLESWMPVFFGLTFCTSIICTSMIAIRLWYVSHKVTSYVVGGKKTRRLFAIQCILIESATMYSTIMFVYLVTYLAKTNYSIIFGDMVAPIIGIVFSLITIRVNEAFNATGSTSTRITFQSPRTIPSHICIPYQQGLKHNVPFAIETHPTVNSASEGGRDVVDSRERGGSEGGGRFHSMSTL